MAKAYWIAFYRKILDPKKLAAYAKLAGPAIEIGGGRFLARGIPAQVYDNGQSERTVLIEFDSVAQAVAVHDSPDYQAALAALSRVASYATCGSWKVFEFILFTTPYPRHYQGRGLHSAVIPY